MRKLWKIVGAATLVAGLAFGVSAVATGAEGDLTAGPGGCCRQ